MRKLWPYLVILCLSLIASYYKSELTLWKSNYDSLIQQHNASKVMVWDKLPKGVTEYSIDTIFAFWGDDYINKVVGKQTFKVNE